MTVGKLIEELKKYPDNLEVSINYEMFANTDIEEVCRGENNGNKVYIVGANI